MGRVTTPTYRVEYRPGSRHYFSPAAWRHEDGRPTAVNVWRHVLRMNSSMQLGGVNAALTGSVIAGARVVRQETGETVAEWQWAQ